MRALYTLLTLAAVLAVYLLMLKGWRSRQRRQSDLPPPPQPPATRAEPLLPPVPGLFVGTAFADDWLDRVAVHELAHRATAWLAVTTDGVHVARDGLPELYLPYSHIRSVTTGDALAGKVIGRDGLVLLDWRLGGRLLTSGFRADDSADHRRVIDAVHPHLTMEVST